MNVMTDEEAARGYAELKALRDRINGLGRLTARALNMGRLGAATGYAKSLGAAETKRFELADRLHAHATETCINQHLFTKEQS